MIKKALIRGLIIAVIIVGIACVGGLGDQIILFLAPPNIYIVIGVILIFILLAILHELRGR